MENEKKVANKLTDKMRKRIMLAGVILLSVCVLVVGVSYLVLRSYVNRMDEDRIYAGIYIGAVNVSEMTVQEAEQALNERIEELGQEQLELVVGSQSVYVPFHEFGVYIKEQSDLIQQAVDYAKEGSVWTRYWRIQEIGRETMVIDVAFGMDEEGLSELIEERTTPLETQPDNATITRENGEFLISDEVIGKVVNLEESVQVVTSYIQEQ